MSIIFRDRWLRFECYELRQQKSRLCVCPAARAEKHTYNPFEVADSLLPHFLRLGWLESRGRCLPEEVLDFVSAYGMLGFATSMIRKEYEDGSVRLHADNFVSRAKALSANEYFSLVLPQVKSAARFFRTPEKMPVTMMMAYANPENTWLCMDNSFYSEQISWITAFAAHLYRLVERAQRGEPFQYELGNVQAALTSESGRPPRLTWRFDSLKSVLDILLTQALTAERRALRLCKRCGKAFAAGNPKTEYCGASCRNTANVKRSRARNKCGDKK